MNVRGKVIETLRLGRVHTAPLEIIPAVAGAAVASGTLYSVQVLLWGVYGFLYHFTGYGMNSLEDWKGGYDQGDPNKQHHPLNTGALSEGGATSIVFISIAITLVYALAISNNVLAVSILVVGAICGGLYNKIGKETSHKYIFIALAHSTVLAAPYVSVAGEITGILFIMWVFMLAWISFQIGVSGDIKDIRQEEEANLLRELGTKIGTYPYKTIKNGKRVVVPADDKDIIKYSLESELFAYGNRLALIVLGYLTYDTLTPLSTNQQFYDPNFWLLMMIAMIGIMGFTNILLLSGPYDRPTRLRQMSLLELSTIAFFLISIIPVIGYTGFLLLIGGSIAWLVPMNRMLWGTYVRPDV